MFLNKGAPAGILKARLCKLWQENKKKRKSERAGNKRSGGGMGGVGLIEREGGKEWEMENDRGEEGEISEQQPAQQQGSDN